MKRITLALIILSLFFATSAFSQDKIQITGQIKDNQTKENLEFCNVSVINQKDSLITIAATNQNGFFTLSLDGGAYRIIISMIGYKTDTTKLFGVSQDKFIGVFQLKPTVVNLSEVSVSESSKEIKTDRDVQIVTEKMKYGATNTQDVLDKVSGVDIDRYSNTLKVDNDAKVIILVDGIEKDQQYIKNLSPHRLKKVEVIRDPGGRYALEGYSAVINIILKKDYQGTEIYLDDEFLADPDAIKTDYIPVSNSVSATVNYVYNKVNVYAKYNNNIAKFNFNTVDKKEYYNGLVIERNAVSNTDYNTKYKQLYHNYTLGTDYYINPKHTLSFETNLSMQPKKQNGSNELYNVVSSLNENILSSDTSLTQNRSYNTNFYASLFYEGNLDDKNVINSNFTFSNYNNSYTNEFSQHAYSIIESGNDHKNATKFYLEYTHTFKNKSSLQVGYGNTWEGLNSNFTTDTTSKFKYTDMRHKLYSYYNWQIAKRLGIKIGIAGETSNPNSDGLKRSYFILQPYLDVKIDASKNLVFKAKYRSATAYPDISQTNPYVTFVDMQSVRTGNPSLKPELVNKVSLQTTIMQGLITIEPYYHFSNNYISEVGTFRSDSIFEFSTNNAGKYRNCGVEVSVTIPFGKNLFLQTSVDVYFSRIRYLDKTNKINDWSTSTQLIYQNIKSKTMLGMQYQKANQKYITAQGYRSGNNDFWVVFVRQPFFKDRLAVQFVYITPITLGVSYKQENYIKTDYYSESRYNHIDILKNIMILELSYRFNKGKSVNKKEKEIEKINEKGNKGLF